MRHLPLTLTAACLVAACARGDTPDPGLTAAVTGSPVNCIQRVQSLTTRPLDGQTILFSGLGRAWRNRLPDACPGLGRTGPVTIVFEEANTQVCRNDRIRVIDNPSAPLPVTSYPLCRLGEFTPVDLKSPR